MSAREWESARVIDGERYVRADEADRAADWLNDVMDGWARRGTDAENRLREAVEALRKLEHGWKDFYDRNVGAWDVNTHGPLTLGNYVRSVVGSQ